MVVVARLLHLVEMAANVHQIHISIGHNLASGKSKVKMCCNKQPDEVPTALRKVTMMTIRSLIDSVASLSVMDRGHRHSSGIAESHFWLQVSASDMQTDIIDECEDCSCVADAYAQTEEEVAATIGAAPRVDSAAVVSVDWLQAVLVRHKECLSRSLRKIDKSQLTDHEYQALSILMTSETWDTQCKERVNRLLSTELFHRVIKSWLAPDVCWLIYTSTQLDT